MNKKIELSERFALMYRKSRADAGKSQEYVARALGVSRKTVQNWESGISTPNQVLNIEWFEALGVSPMPYQLEVAYPNTFSTAKNDDEHYRNELIRFIKNASPNIIKKLFFVLCGKHGSDPISVVEIGAMHLNVPLQARIQLAQNTLNSYRLFKALGGESIDDSIQVDEELLEAAIKNALEAVKKNEKGYTLIKGDKLH